VDGQAEWHRAQRSPRRAGAAAKSLIALAEIRNAILFTRTAASRPAAIIR